MRIQCPHCRNEEQDMIEEINPNVFFCKCCAKVWINNPIVYLVPEGMADCSIESENIIDLYKKKKRN